MPARTYETAAARWAGVGPYYAMFPVAFADKIVSRYTEPGDVVLDPFAGRGTAVFSAAHQGRHGLGIEINEVGWVYGATKLQPATQTRVEARLRKLGALAPEYREAALRLPVFFRHCFAPAVRSFLVGARAELDWRRSIVDRTVMALLLVHLHGKEGSALSNQMRQTKSMAPAYAVKWWLAQGAKAPRIDPVEFLIERLDWRYVHGRPGVTSSIVYLGDSSVLLSRIPAGRRRCGRRKGVQLLFTSPPYFNRTNYHADQWLRLWLLGGPPNARRPPDTFELKGRFSNQASYEDLLTRVFSASAELLHRKAQVYVRTGLGDVTYETTRSVLKDIFPKKRLVQRPCGYSGPTQTLLFGDRGRKPGEVDLILVPR